MGFSLRPRRREPQLSAVPSAHPTAHDNAISIDPGADRLLEIEPAVGRGDWQAVSDGLAAGGSPELTPTETLLRVVALREIDPAGGDANLTSQAIRAVASLLGVGATSPVALVIAKRILRRNPQWQQQQPSAALSFGVVLAGLAASGIIGWVISRLLL